MANAIKIEEGYYILADYMDCSVQELFDKYKMNRYYVDMSYLGTHKTAYDCLVLTRDDWPLVALSLEYGEIYDESLNNVTIRQFYLEDELEDKHPDLYKKLVNWDKRNKQKKNRIINKSKTKKYINSASKEELKEIEEWIKNRKKDLK